MNKILISILISISAAFAQFYYTPTAQGEGTGKASSTPEVVCSGDLAELSLQKRTLAKKFAECADKRSHHTISVLFFRVAEWESGGDEEQECFKEYAEAMNSAAICLATTHPEVSFFSIDEKNSYLYAWTKLTKHPMALNQLLHYIQNFKQIQEQEKEKHVLDKFNTFDEELSLRSIPLDEMEFVLSEMNGSREDKDILLLYFKYLKANSDYRFRCSVKSSFVCDTTWLGEYKNEFLKKYPESSYREFVETQMAGFTSLTKDEKLQKKAENQLIKQKKREQEIAQKIAERDVWVALTGIAMFGIPVTSTKGFDDNFDVSKMFGISLKASWRRAFFQYQYNFAPGDNNMGGSIAEKSYSLMAGGIIGPKKWFTIDLMVGLSYIDTYPKVDGISPYRDYSSWAFAAQGNYYFPIADSWDIVAHVQARMNYVVNECRDSYWQQDENRCTDPNRGGNPQDKSWDDLQWTFSVGVGIRFWKPKPASWY